MTEPTPAHPEGIDELQFDHAEPAHPEAAPPAVTCAVCNQTVEGVYYDINSKITCERCCQVLEAKLRGGSRIRRVCRAAFFGTLAAVAGWAIYFGIAKLTGYEFGLISILVGFMVGSAVRKGADMRGGWFYQAMAIFLTYSAIVATYVPFMMDELMKTMDQQEQGQVAGAPQKPGAPPAAAPGEAPAVPKEVRESTLFYAIMIPVLFIAAYATPFLAGASNLLGLVIIFFALQQAWRLNKKLKLVVNGPFKVGQVKIPQDNVILDDQGGTAPLAGAPEHA